MCKDVISFETKLAEASKSMLEYTTTPISNYNKIFQKDDLSKAHTCFDGNKCTI